MINAQTYCVTPDNSFEVRCHHFVTDASDLRLPPGFMPDSLPTSLGNGQPFLFVETTDEAGRARYAQHLGCVTLEVFPT